MANISPEGASLIRDHVSDWSPDDATIAAALNAPSIANPDPQATVAKAFVTRDLMEVLDDAAKAKLLTLPSLARLLDDISAGVIVPLENWVVMLATGAVITSEQASALYAILHATEPDPAWPSQISWAAANLGRPVDHQDIAEARQGVSL